MRSRTSDLGCRSGCVLQISPQEEVRRGVPRPQGGGAAAKAVPVPKVRTVGGP